MAKKLQAIGDHDIDFRSEKLLELIAVSHENGRLLNTTKAMSLQAIGSPATIHRRLNKLYEAGLIEAKHLGKDRKTKWLIPTAKANKYFARLGSILIRACKS